MPGWPDPACAAPAADRATAGAVASVRGVAGDDGPVERATASGLVAGEAGPAARFAPAWVGGASVDQVSVEASAALRAAVGPHEAKAGRASDEAASVPDGEGEGSQLVGLPEVIREITDSLVPRSASTPVEAGPAPAGTERCAVGVAPLSDRLPTRGRDGTALGSGVVRCAVGARGIEAGAGACLPNIASVVPGEPEAGASSAWSWCVSRCATTGRTGSRFAVGACWGPSGAACGPLAGSGGPSGPGGDPAGSSAAGRGPLVRRWIVVRSGDAPAVGPTGSRAAAEGASPAGEPALAGAIVRATGRPGSARGVPGRTAVLGRDASGAPRPARWFPAVGGLPESEAVDAVDAVGAAVVGVAAGATDLWTGRLVGSAGPFVPVGAPAAAGAELDCSWMRLLARGRSADDAVGVAGSARVSDRSGGRTDASGGTTARLLVGGSPAIGATGAGAETPVAAGEEPVSAEGPAGAGAAAACGVADAHDPPASDAGTSMARR
jgi:hypothetical protein